MAVIRSADTTTLSAGLAELSIDAVQDAGWLSLTRMFNPLYTRSSLQSLFHPGCQENHREGRAISAGAP